MEVTAANLAGINKSFQTKFNQARNLAPGFYKKLCMECPSAAAENVYGWLASLPQIGRKTGEYIKKRLQLLGYRLTNETWGGIIEIQRESIEDDTYAMFAPTASLLGQRAGQVPDLELTQLLINAFSSSKGKDYTNSAFFSAAKKAHGKATAFTNSGVKKISAANFEAALAGLVERVDAEGVPLYLGQDSSMLYLVVCSDDQSTAEAIVKLPTLSGGGANPNYQKAQLIVLPGLQSAAQASSVINDADARPWFLLDCSQAVKPFIYQPRSSFEITPNFSLTSDAVFNQDVFQWKARGRMALGYGLPEYAYGSTGAEAA
jgi:phage major head subunit gpT-like protein